MFDFDEIFELFGDGDDEAPEGATGNPDFRAVIDGQRIQLNPWMPWLADTGPFGALLRARENDAIVIADLTVVGEQRDELIARFRTAPDDVASVEQVLLDWATAVGYRRVWFSDRLVPIDSPLPLGGASVRCPTCRASWRERDPEFWHEVRSAGHFPWVCPICAGDLPQWTVRARKARTANARRRGGGEAQSSGGPWSGQAQAAKRAADRSDD